MKLRNYTLKYLSLVLPVIIGVWAIIFYYNMIDEVYDSIDDGLENYKMLIIKRASEDSLLLHKNAFAESNYLIEQIEKDEAMLIRDEYKDTSMFMTNEDDFEPVRMLTTAFSLNEKFFRLKVISSMVEEDDLVEDLFYSLIWLYVALLLSVIIINNFLLKRAWKPFHSLLNELKSFRLNQQKTLEVPSTEIEEFNKLNEAVLQMANNSIETYASQKQFIENASHELQTPLAISINKLELLVEQQGIHTSAEQITSVIETLERLTRLNKSLLLLSKIENKQFNQDENIDVNESIKNLVDEFNDLASFKNIHITVIEHGSLRTFMDKGLSAILISNLLKNAIAYNHENGKISIGIFNDHFVISNTGSDEALDEEKIFTRFYKNSNQKQSTGLGLAIVKAIVTYYNAPVKYEFVNGMHQMKVSFKHNPTV